MSTDERLELLSTRGVITPAARALSMDATRAIETEWGVELSDDVWGMGVTHLATAIARRERGEDLPSVDGEILAEAETRPAELALARRIVAGVDRALGRPLGGGETYLLAIHLAAAHDRLKS